MPSTNRPAPQKPDFSGIIKNNPCGFITRKNIYEATGGIIKPKYAADLDANPDKDSINGRFSVGRKICYPVHEVVAFLERRAQMI